MSLSRRGHYNFRGVLETQPEEATEKKIRLSGWLCSSIFRAGMEPVGGEQSRSSPLHNLWLAFDWEEEEEWEEEEWEEEEWEKKEWEEEEWEKKEWEEEEEREEDGEGEDGEGEEEGEWKWEEGKEEGEGKGNFSRAINHLASHDNCLRSTNQRKIEQQRDNTDHCDSSFTIFLTVSRSKEHKYYCCAWCFKTQGFEQP
ncbi:hypothetical protein Pmani_018776 [Petrolisthes manimaculis]|uniref:Uncharacterized protein n=1 Tax=Petrolisthes manimaculis TaxID=1843537 RepID=A0AAE1PM19_9EUCA|nr:hypothetical protein Pmani_018776 [Petrolisthes manimaculis]